MPVRSKIKGEFIHPRSVRRGESTLIPGFDKGQQRPVLSFVLKVLAGKDSKAIQLHLAKIGGQPQFSPEKEWVEASMVATMRQLADMWIDSGKDASNPGVDTPSERNVEVQLLGRNGSLFEWINNDLLNDLPKWTGMTRDGKQGIKDKYPEYNSNEEVPWGLKCALERFGERMAMFWFMKLLDSPYSLNLTRCDDCNGYFAYERVRKRQVKNGVSCPDCKGKASNRRNISTRERRTGEMVGLAADVWKKWKQDNRHGKRSDWVAIQVRESTKQKIVFTGNWVTRHQTEIEAEVERRNYAKG
jgi:hypothetical protein